MLTHWLLQWNVSSFMTPYWNCGLKLEPSQKIQLGMSQRTFQRRLNVAFRLIWRRDATQRQNNAKTTLFTSTLKFTTFNNVETTLCISMLNWTTLDNVETTLSFSTSTSQRWTTSKQRCEYNHLKKIKPRLISKIMFLSFKDYAGLKIFFNFSPF